MHASNRLRMVGAFEPSLILFVLVGQGTLLLTLLGFAAGVDVTPGIAIAMAGSAA